MTVQVFPKLENIDLTEYAADSAYEDYTGIVLDPEDQIFKTVSGKFHDKKDFYEKLSKRGYVVRKVFEKRVFDWIERNAKTTLEAYLMFSTAFSKWKGNNLLDPYYVKLLNDIPQLNREKIKGDPNSIGDQKEESTLEEDLQNIDIEGRPDWRTHEVTVIPVNDPSNELIIQKVKFDPVVMQLIKDYKTQNKPVEFYNKLNTMLSSSREFVQSLGDELRPLNRDTKFKFYDPKKDNRSPLYREGSGRNPVRFNIKIDGETLLDMDDKPYELNKNSVLNWYSNWNRKDFDYDGTDAIEVNAVARDLKKQNSEFALLNAAADLEKYSELSMNAEQDEAEAKKVLKNLLFAKPENLAKGPFYTHFVTEDEHNKALEFDRDLHNFTNPDLTSDERKKLWAKYGAENQQEAINTLKKQQKAFYNKIAEKAKTTIPDNRKDQIIWLKEYINNVEKANLSDNYTKLTLLNTLRQGLENLLKQRDPKVSNKLKTDYEHPETSPVDAPRTGWIDQPKGAKAKHTTTQADLGVNKGIHSFGKESTWNEIVNGLKENGIPKVDADIFLKSIRHVNYGATGDYLDQPVDGVITNPGASFDTGGRFFSEDADPQWDNRAHDTLNQELFDGTHLRPEVREALLRIAGKFQNTLGLNIEPVDIYFTGSGANFNYNEMSDIDLHLVYDFEQIGINAEILVKYFIAKKQVFNNDYDITIKGMPVEVGVENVNEPIVSSAIYSVVKDQWMLEPKDAEHLLPKPDMKQYYEIVQRIEDAIESRNSKRIGDLWDELYRIRKDSLAHDGEYGHGNGLFKKLRNLGYLDRLKHAYYSSASEELSLEALKDII